MDTSNKVLSKGIESSMEDLPIENGKIRFTTDTNKIFLDDNGERHEITDFVKGYTEEEILNILTPLPKFYYSSDTHKIFYHDSNEWNLVIGYDENYVKSLEDKIYSLEEELSNLQSQMSIVKDILLEYNIDIEELA